MELRYTLIGQSTYLCEYTLIEQSSLSTDPLHEHSCPNPGFSFSYTFCLQLLLIQYVDHHDRKNVTKQQPIIYFVFCMCVSILLCSYVCSYVAISIYIHNYNEQ